MKRAAAAVVLLLAAAPAAFGADAPAASFGPPDPAGVRCELLAAMNERAPTGTERQVYNWAQGYFAGRSAAAVPPAPRTLPAAGDARARTWQQLLALCAARPAGTVGDAVEALWNQAR